MVKLLLENAKDRCSVSTTVGRDVQSYRQALAFAKDHGYKSIHEILQREQPNVWRCLGNSNTVGGGHNTVMRIHFPEIFKARKSLVSIIETLRETVFTKAILLHDRWPKHETAVKHNPTIVELTKYRILPYAYGLFGREVDKRREVRRVTRPYLSLIVTDNDNPLKLVEELKKRSDIGVFASNLRAEVIVGEYKEPVIVDKKYHERDEKEVFLYQLQPHNLEETYQLRGTPWLIDVYVREWGVSINLPAVVEQAAKDCRYFGRFMYEGRRLRVERIDPKDQPWDSRGF